MIIQHKQFFLEVTYSAATKSYYGELLDFDQTISVMATKKRDAVVALMQLAESYLT